MKVYDRLESLQIHYVDGVFRMGNYPFAKEADKIEIIDSDTGEVLEIINKENFTRMVKASKESA